MTNPDDEPRDPNPPRARSGTQIVVGMLLAVVLILWTFDIVVTAFGPPEAGMSVSFVNGSDSEPTILVCGELEAGWTKLFGDGAPGGRLLPGAERSVDLLVQPGQVWTIASLEGDPEHGAWISFDVIADPQRQLVVEWLEEGELRLREGPSLISHARRHVLARHSLEDWPSLRSRASLPPVLSASTPLPDAPDVWSFGPPVPDA